MVEEQAKRASRYLIYGMLAALPLERIPSFDLALLGGATVRISQLLGLILILINLPLLYRCAGTLLKSPWRYLLAYLAVVVLSIAVSANAPKAFLVTAFTFFVALVAWTLALRFERDKIRVYILIILASASAAGIFGLYQFFADLAGLPPHLTGLREQYTKALFGFPRIQSTALEPLYFGNFLLIPIGLSAAAMALTRRVLPLVILVPLMMIVVMTVSRGAIAAMLGMIVLALTVALARGGWRQAGLLAGSTALSFALATGLIAFGTQYAPKPNEKTEQAVQNFSKQTTNISVGESAEGRAFSRELAYRLWLDHPVLGVGIGNFGTHAAFHAPERFKDERGIVNNEPLEILAETGLLGFVTLGLFLLALIWQAFRRLLSTENTALAVLILGLLLALLGTLAQYMTFSTLYITHVWVMIGLLAGAALHKRPAKAE